VHVLENNEGLLERDFAQNAAFYARLNVKSGKDLNDPQVQVCYCLKKNLDKWFLRRMADDSLELDRTVLIVDEVDDLIVNERPNMHYIKPDAINSPALAECLAALKAGAPKPSGASESIWLKASRDLQTAKSKQRDVHYRVLKDANGVERAVQLNSSGEMPKVPLTSPWLKALNFLWNGTAPIHECHFACVCAPYMFNRYKGIFGLTGSVGSQAELAYLTKTYHAITFRTPRFLETCVQTPHKVVLNHGVEIHSSSDRQRKRVVELCETYFRQVPILVIASSNEELGALHKAVSSSSVIPQAEVQRFSEFDAAGVSLRSEWQTIIDDATKRLGSADDNRCRVTVTDNFGGRGHDFQVVDKEANANGGMLVIATSMPDEREWIQWKGRTARQDRSGQFYVILNEKAEPLASNKPLLAKLKKATLRSSGDKSTQTDHDGRIEILLDAADEGIDEKLKKYATEQALGERLNAVCEGYFKRYPRDFDSPWPSSKYELDMRLAEFLQTLLQETNITIVRERAKEELGLTIG